MGRLVDYLAMFLEIMMLFFVVPDHTFFLLVIASEK